ncbi:2TM domain-containing protein [Muricauda sp. CAU 1633]|uniref:2TM domain-containing protein n=1 Tax=Allomuricauda sp. CAU 1633 TaxID=2816036 RepID=UPI001A8FABF2|nr:2TM domain-containing protein [Muricauda sp. CAU 1633]MBO0322355.1 2TM domain-containing protein [Muricauda sp. CAU 1633]
MEDVENKYTKATKRVKELKDFYRHLKIFFIINAILYLFKAGVLQQFLPEDIYLKPYYFNWVDAHLVIWILILAIHAGFLFRHKLPFLQKWEERQIQKYMEKEEHEKRRYK